MALSSETILKLVNPSMLRYVIKEEFDKPTTFEGWLNSTQLFWRAEYKPPVTEQNGNGIYTKFNINIDFKQRTEADIVERIKLRLKEEYGLEE